MSFNIITPEGEKGFLVPDGGAEGQVLKKTAEGFEWGSALDTKAAITLDKHTDGLIYIFVNGEKVGNGVEVTGEVVEGDIIGNFDEDNNILLSGDIADGTYKLKYQNTDGEWVEYGTLTVAPIVYYTVAQNLTNVTSSNSATSVRESQSFTATITVNDGYTLSSVVVTMGGTDITNTAVSGGIISIASVTGDVVITAVAESALKGNLADPTSEDWLTDTRLATSYGYGKTATGNIFTNYIPAKMGDILRVKGLNLYATSPVYASVAIYRSTDKTADSTGKYNAYQQYAYTGASSAISGDGAKNQVSVDDNGVYTYTILLMDNGNQRATSETAYIRISAALADGYTSEDVIITINEEIV